MDKSSENLQFSWGRKKAKGGLKMDTQFYESFTFDNVKYSLYDCVYLFKHGDPEPYIGKIVKIWQQKGVKKVKVLWFFIPNEIQNYLTEPVMEKEIFLASGEGTGLADINPLDAIAGKCTVVCISKDKRNRQPSLKEQATADYIFYRFFDVGNCTISDHLPEKIAGLEVNVLLNPKNEQVTSISYLEMQGMDHKESESPVGAIQCPPPQSAPLKILDSVPKPTQDKGHGDVKHVKDVECPLDVKVKEETQFVDGNTNRTKKKSQSAPDGERPTKKVKLPQEVTTSPRDLQEQVDEKKSALEFDQGDEKKSQSAPSGGRSSKEIKLSKDITTLSGDLLNQGGVEKSIGEFDQDQKDSRRPSQSQSQKLKIVETKIRNLDQSVAQVPPVLPEKRQTVEPNHNQENFRRPVQSHFQKMKNGTTDLDKSAQKVDPSDRDKTVCSGPAEPITRAADRSKWFKIPWDARLQTADEQGTLVYIQNLDIQFAAADIEELILEALQLKCIAKPINHPTYDDPNHGKAYAIFKTKVAADTAVSRINAGLVVNGRPLYCSKGLLKIPKPSATLVGHLSIDNLKKFTKQREEQKKAVSTSHCSQPNTMEYDLALEWILAREKQQKKFRILHEKHAESRVRFESIGSRSAKLGK